jgi:tRNA uridine 5-carbamoylmethylation protein Kti12
MEKGKTLILLRGLPGSGKSTTAKLLGAGGAGYAHFEADMYFMENGKYKFDPMKIKDAHKWCQNSVEHAMLLNHTTGHNSTIIVSNTFTQEWEMEQYYKMAESWGYRVHSIIVENRHGGVNEHGVPEEKLEQMKNRFEIKL